MKVALWIAGAVVLTCLVFPPLFFGWVIAFIAWVIADKGFKKKQSALPSRQSFGGPVVSKRQLDEFERSSTEIEKGLDVELSQTVEFPDALGNDYRTAELREQVESTLSTPGLYETIPEEHIHNWEQRAELVVLPPDEWRINGSPGRVVVDGDWSFPLKATSEEDWQLYIYTVKGFPDLHKIGIAKDVLKRKEKYYGRCVKKWTLPKRDAVVVEYLFKHATYGLANKNIPRWNVGNADEENLQPKILDVWEKYPDSKGLTEVRLISAEAAKTTLEQIQQDLNWHLKVDELVLKYGIQTFGGDLSGRGTVQIPHRFWRLKPHHEPTRRETDGANSIHDEMSEHFYQIRLKEYEDELQQCWDAGLLS